jgi:hypothetical protein
MHLVLGEARVAAVDHEVARGEHAGQLVDDRLRDRAGRHHHPHDPWGGKRLGERREGGHVGDLLVGVVARDLESCLAHPRTHVVAHPAEADESEVKGSLRHPVS